MNAIVLFTAEVFGVLLRVLEFQGKRWLCAVDVKKVFEYRAVESVVAVLARHKDDLAPHSVKARIGGKGQAVRLFDENGLRYFCEYSPRPGALHLLRWLDAGGLQSNSDDVIPFDSEPAKSVSADAFDSKPKSENVFVFESHHHQHKNILAFKRPNSESACAFAPPRDALGKQELYCFSLLELLIEFTSQAKDADVGDNLLVDIQTSLDDLLDEVLRDNYAPELNAARYELYSSYWLEGGEV